MWWWRSLFDATRPIYRADMRNRTLNDLTRRISLFFYERWNDAWAEDFPRLWERAKERGRELVEEAERDDA